MDQFAAEQGWDGWEPEAIEVETVKPPKTGINYDRLGENIRGYRLEAGLTQADLAETIGTTQQTVQNWEQGRNMTIDSIYAVAAAIGMDNPLDLLRGVELQD